MGKGGKRDAKREMEREEGRVQTKKKQVQGSLRERREREGSKKGRNGGTQDTERERERDGGEVQGKGKEKGEPAPPPPRSRLHLRREGSKKRGKGSEVQRERRGEGPALKSWKLRAEREREGSEISEREREGSESLKKSWVSIGTNLVGSCTNHQSQWLVQDLYQPQGDWYKLVPNCGGTISKNVVSCCHVIVSSKHTNL